MSEVSKFMLKDVRCFEGYNEFEIRPLTFLVGENSTGKSTVLGCFQALSDFLLFLSDFIPFRSSDRIDFNSAPYQMGAYSDIARKTQSRAKEFQLGIEIRNRKYALTLVAREDGSEPMIRAMTINFFDGAIIVNKKRPVDREASRRREEFDNIDIREEKGNKFIVTFDSNHNYFEMLTSPDGMWTFIMLLNNNKKAKSSAEKNFVRYIKEIIPRESSDGLSRYYSSEVRTYSFAPIRSKPERTYNPLKETASPEGSEMPMVLMNLYMSKKKQWKDLKENLENFGKSSGLFTGIGVRELGSSASDPFQLQVKVRGPKGNIVDVGYGVSQILPILVRIMTTKGSRFLLQQPEVHLHPKGQAELTSLLIDMKNKNKNSFIVETHSDAMINRARIEIMQGKLKPKDVSLIYLEPSGNKVEVHNIRFDENANMMDVPESYRDFFMKEQDKLLGFGD